MADTSEEYPRHLSEMKDNADAPDQFVRLQKQVDTLREELLDLKNRMVYLEGQVEPKVDDL